MIGATLIVVAVKVSFPIAVSAVAPLPTAVSSIRLVPWLSALGPAGALGLWHLQVGGGCASEKVRLMGTTMMFKPNAPYIFAWLFRPSAAAEAGRQAADVAGEVRSVRGGPNAGTVNFS